MKQARTIADIQEILINANADQLEIPVEIINGKYQITPALLNAYGLEVTQDGKLKRKETVLHKTNSEIGLGEVYMDVDEGEIWRIVALLSSMKAGVGVADRVMTMRIRHGLTDYTAQSLFHTWNSNDPVGDIVTCSAGQYGYLYYSLPGPNVSGGWGIKNDDGVSAAAVNIPGIVYLRGAATNGGRIKTHITNEYITDTIGISILYEIVGTGQ